MSKMINDIYRNYADFELKCPFKKVKKLFHLKICLKLRLSLKGSYHLTNMKLDDKLVPTYILPDNMKYMFYAKTLARVTNIKKFVELFTTKVVNQIIRE